MVYQIQKLAPRTTCSIVKLYYKLSCGLKILGTLGGISHRNLRDSIRRMMIPARRPPMMTETPVFMTFVRTFFSMVWSSAARNIFLITISIFSPSWPLFSVRPRLYSGTLLFVFVVSSMSPLAFPVTVIRPFSLERAPLFFPIISFLSIGHTPFSPRWWWDLHPTSKLSCAKSLVF